MRTLYSQLKPTFAGQIQYYYSYVTVGIYKPCEFRFLMIANGRDFELYSKSGQLVAMLSKPFEIRTKMYMDGTRISRLRKLDLLKFDLQIVWISDKDSICIDSFKHRR